MTTSAGRTYTLHLWEQEDGSVILRALDDANDYSYQDTFQSMAEAALEGAIVLNARKLLEKEILESYEDSKKRV